MSNIIREDCASINNFDSTASALMEINMVNTRTCGDDKTKLRKVVQD
ncbi:hypothetical protein Tco_1511696, partial [Tanacetum coccineum]